MKVKKYRMRVTRYLEFETDYSVRAETEESAKDKAVELDEQNDLLAGNWTQCSRKTVRCYPVASKRAPKAKKEASRG